ncbi:DUF460 domain-containing protein [Candidatus Woesearchaeota archaeon]|nr:DUF460 domain-containing protein [Candidatus Woesearchaeota archaeon]
MQKKLLIAGIDPGATKAYALFTPEKELVACFSRKECSLAELIRETTQYGKILIAGTDKRKVPEFVEKFATKVGARVIAPRHDLELTEKLDLSREYDAQNAHEKDAIASALAAYKEIEGTIGKVARFAAAYKKEALQDAILELVLIHNVSIKLAADILERPEAEYSKETKKILEQPKLGKPDFVRLLQKLHEREREITLLRQQIMRLQDEIKLKQTPLAPLVPAQKTREPLLSRRVGMLYRSLDEKSRQVDAAKVKLAKLNALIGKLGTKYALVKKLDTLGQQEFSRRAALLGIQTGDILLVANPSVYSESTLEKLKDVIIIYRKKPAAVVAQQLICIPAESVELHEDLYFAAVHKEQLHTKIAAIERLQKVIEAYKDERNKLKA